MKPKIALWVTAFFLMLGYNLYAQTTKKEVLHLQTSATDYQKLRITPKIIEKWEDGRRIVQDKNNYEWWYFDATMNDGTIVVAVFSDNFIGDEKRGIYLVITSPDGKEYTYTSKTDTLGVYSTEKTDVRIEKNRFSGDLDNYTIYVDANNSEKMGINLKLKRTIPSFRAETGVISYEEKYFAWLNAVPHGEVEGTITYGGITHNIAGTGYHDHNWGNVPINKLLDNWWWGRGNVANRSTVVYEIHGKRNLGGADITLLYVGEKDKILVNSNGGDVITTHGSLKPHGDKRHSRQMPNNVNYEAQGYKIEFSTTEKPISSENMLNGQSGLIKIIAKVMGMKPWYTRYDSPTVITLPNEEKTTGKGILEYYELK